MKQIDVRLTAIPGVPLLMKSHYGIDWKNPIAQEIARIVRKTTRNRTEQDREKIEELQFHLALYHDKELGPFIPAESVEAAMLGGARAIRMGTKAEAALLVEPAMIPLEYKGPREPDQLYRNKDFVDRRPTKAGTSGGMAITVRPIFRDWSIKFVVLFREDQLDAEDIKRFLENASSTGIGSYRPRFGRFQLAAFSNGSKGSE